MIPRPPRGSVEVGSIVLVALISVLNSERDFGSPQLAAVVVLCIIAAVASAKGSGR